MWKTHACSFVFVKSTTFPPSATPPSGLSFSLSLSITPNPSLTRNAGKAFSTVVKARCAVCIPPTDTNTSKQNCLSVHEKFFRFGTWRSSRSLFITQSQALFRWGKKGSKHKSELFFLRWNKVNSTLASKLHNERDSNSPYNFVYSREISDARTSGKVREFASSSSFLELFLKLHDGSKIELAVDNIRKYLWLHSKHWKGEMVLGSDGGLS